jgi:hypothetical protein
MKRTGCCRPACPQAGAQRGATLVEFVIIAPTLLVMTLAMLQTALVFHARSSVTYAGFEAARSAALDHARPQTLYRTFARAIIPYYGGGRSNDELAATHARVMDDLPSALRIEILSPSPHSFDDYHSPRAAQKLGVRARVIPNTHLRLLQCPIDRPGCAHDPASNRSGQTLRDANLLQLRLTFGIPRTKQIPLAGRFFNWAVATIHADHPDAFRRKLLADGRIPVVSQVMLRMQSDAIEPETIAIGGLPPEAEATPVAEPTTGPSTESLPDCSWSDPLCTPQPGSDSGAGSGDGLLEDAEGEDGALQCS